MFIDLLTKVRVSNIDGDVETLLKDIFKRESDRNLAKDASHIYAENEPTVKKNEAAVNEPGELYTIGTAGNVPDDCKYPLALIQAAQNQKQTNMEGLAKLLKLKTDSKVYNVNS